MWLLLSSPVLQNSGGNVLWTAACELSTSLPSLLCLRPPRCPRRELFGLLLVSSFFLCFFLLSLWWSFSRSNSFRLSSSPRWWWRGGMAGSGGLWRPRDPAPAWSTSLLSSSLASSLSDPSEYSSFSASPTGGAMDLVLGKGERDRSFSRSGSAFSSLTGWGRLASDLARATSQRRCYASFSALAQPQPPPQPRTHEAQLRPTSTLGRPQWTPRLSRPSTKCHPLLVVLACTCYRSFKSDALSIKRQRGCHLSRTNRSKNIHIEITESAKALCAAEIATCAFEKMTEPQEVYAFVSTVTVWSHWTAQLFCGCEV